MDEEKKDWRGTIFSGFFILFFAGLGLLSGYYGAEIIGKISFTDVIYTVFILLVSFPLHVFLHEIGHVFGGLVSGYEFIMFRFFNFLWIKTDSGLSQRKQYLPGILGQALMVPPKVEADDNPPFFLYHVSGLLMNGLTAILFVMLGGAFKSGLAAYFLYLSAGVAIFLLVTNALPVQGTDGYNLIQHFKREEVNNEVTDTLYMYRDMVNGATFQYLQRYVDLESFDSLTDPTAVTMYTVRAASFLEAYDFEGACEIYSDLWQHLDELFAGHKPDVTFNYLFTLLLTDPSHPDVETITDSKLYKDYSKVEQGDILRVFAAVALYVEDDYDQAEELLDEGEKAIEFSPTVSEEKLEKSLYQYLRKDLVLKRHQSVFE